MNLKFFRARIRELLRPSGYSQKMLAYAMGLQPTALSNKLNGTGETSLKHPEARQILKILAEWEVITTQAEAFELLELVNLKPNSFSKEEWSSAPLNKLAPIQEKAAVAASPQELTHFLAPTPTSPAPDIEEEEAKKVSPALPLPPHNLPAQSTVMIGRQHEISRVCDLLQQPSVRLLNLTGTGGIGKTRLALGCAAALLPYFRDGVFFVSLDSVNNPALLLQTIARTLTLKETGSRSLNDLLKDYLASRQLLLVLDNFEQVLAGARELNRLLADHPGLKILVTSRVLLRVYGEYEYLVPPLPLPGQGYLETSGTLVEDLLKSEAINLFCQRAQATRPAFQLTVENAHLVVEICRRLDGLPLAIELAVSRLKTMSLQNILARLDHRLELLNRGPTDLPARQQTLRTLFDWSYDLLSNEEQTLLTGLSIFAGGCDTAAVWAICRGNTSSLAALQDRLTDLVDKSMLRATEDSAGQTRFTMLDTVREYASEKLSATPDEPLLRERHLNYFLELAKAGEAGSVTSEQNGWLVRLETEHANIRTALAWALTKTNSDRFSEKALQLSSCLAWFWDAHGHLSEGRRWLEQALQQWSENCQTQADDTAQPVGEADRKLELRAKALNAAGNLARRQGDSLQATFLLEESLVLRRRLGQPREVAKTLNNLGVLVFNQGDLVKAEALYKESLVIKNELGETYSSALTLNNLGELYYEKGDKQAALSYFEQSLALLDTLDDVHSRAVVLLNLGSITAELKSFNRAEALLRESLAVLNELGDKFHVAEALEGLGLLALEKNQPERAAMLYGAAESLRTQIDAPLPPRQSRPNPFADQANIKKFEAGHSGAMSDKPQTGHIETTDNENLQESPARFEAASWLEEVQAGKKMPLSEIITFALQVSDKGEELP